MQVVKFESGTAYKRFFKVAPLGNGAIELDAQKQSTDLIIPCFHLKEERLLPSKSANTCMTIYKKKYAIYGVRVYVQCRGLAKPIMFKTAAPLSSSLFCACPALSGQASSIPIRARA